MWLLGKGPNDGGAGAVRQFGDAIRRALLGWGQPKLPQQIAESIVDDGAEHHRVTSDRSREPPS
jgi:hypothetical protein